MNQKTPKSPDKLEIKSPSIILESYRTLEKLTDPELQSVVIDTFAGLCKVQMEARSLPLPPVLPAGEVHLKKLELITYWVLLLFTEYLALNKQKHCSTAEIDMWLSKSEKLERYIENLEKEFNAEHLICYKVLIFISAMRSHVLVIGNKNLTAVLSSVYQFACTLQEYINRVEHLKKHVKGFEETTFSKEASRLFYDRQKEVATNSWCKAITQTINRTLEFVMTRAECETQEIAFLEYMVGCLSENKPVNCKLPEHLQKFDLLQFQKNMLLATTKVLTTPTNVLSGEVQKEGIALAKLKFLHLQFQHPALEEYIGLRTAADELSRQAMPFLCIYLYFSHSFDLNFLGKNPLHYRDLTEPGKFKQFFQRACAASELTHFHRLIELTNDFNESAVRHLLVYLLMDRVEDKKLFQQALHTIKISKFGELLLKQAINTLGSIFSSATSATKIQTIKNYLCEVQKAMTSWNSFSFFIPLFLICKKALEFKDSELTERVAEILEHFQCAVEGKKPPVKVNALPPPLEEKPKTKAKAKSTRPKKSPQATRPKKTAKPKIATTVAFAEISEVFVTHESPPPQPEPRAPSPTTLTPPDKDSEEESPENTEISTTTTIVAALAPPQLVISLGNYLKQNQHVSVEKLADQEKNNGEGKVKTRSGFNPLETLMTCFNKDATSANQYKFALFLFGSAQLRQKYFNYPVFANDLDLRANCTFTELMDFLTTHQSQLNMKMTPVWGKHPVVRMEFLDNPSLTLDITPMRDDTTRKITLQKLIKKLQAQADFAPNAIFSTLVDDEEIFIDSQEGRQLLGQVKRELRLVTLHHPAETAPHIILRAVRFLAKCPDFTLHPTFLTWINENKALLSTQQDQPFAGHVSHAFVKLLYSGKAAACLALLQQMDLLKILSPELDHKMSCEEFVAKVKYFDMHKSHACLQRPFHEYHEVCQEVLKEFSLTLPAIEIKPNNGKWKPLSQFLQTGSTPTQPPAEIKNARLKNSHK